MKFVSWVYDELIFIVYIYIYIENMSTIIPTNIANARYDDIQQSETSGFQHRNASALFSGSRLADQKDARISAQKPFKRRWNPSTHNKPRRHASITARWGSLPRPKQIFGSITLLFW